MGKVVQLDTYRATEHTDTPKREDHSLLLTECKSLQSDLSSLLEGFEELKDTITEYNRKKGWHLKG